MITKLQLPLFPALSVAKYVMNVSPIVNNHGERTDGVTVTDGTSPELSKVRGSFQDTLATLSFGLASILMSSGQSMSGVVTSVV